MAAATVDIVARMQCFSSALNKHTVAPEKKSFVRSAAAKQRKNIYSKIEYLSFVRSVINKQKAHEIREQFHRNLFCAN